MTIAVEAQLLLLHLHVALKLRARHTLGALELLFLTEEALPAWFNIARESDAGATRPRGNHVVPLVAFIARWFERIAVDRALELRTIIALCATQALLRAVVSFFARISRNACHGPARTLSTAALRPLVHEEVLPGRACRDLVFAITGDIRARHDAVTVACALDARIIMVLTAIPLVARPMLESTPINADSGVPRFAINIPALEDRGRVALASAAVVGFPCGPHNVRTRLI